jgi:amino acid transporter
MEQATQQHSPRHYKQELDRGLHVLGNVMMTISGVAPTASVFIIAPIAFLFAGTGAFWSFIIAGVIGIGMAFAYAEAGTAFPVTGGEWALVSRILGRPLGFVTLVFMLISVIVIPSSIALGASQYLSVIWAGANQNLVAAIIMLVVGGLAVLQIKTNSIIQGVLLGVELIAVLSITILGFANVHQSGSVLIHPVMYDSSGTAVAVTFGMIMSAVVFAIFAFNGYGGAIVFSEETKHARKNIARAILWTLLITVLVELIPVTAAILGAPSLTDFMAAPSPMQYILTTLGNDTVNTVISLLVFVAIFNSCLAIVVLMSRIVFGSGRDKVWPEPFNAWLAKVHPRFKSPWVAAVVMAVIGAILCASTTKTYVVTFTGVVLAFTYILIAGSSIVVRLRFKDLPQHYKMPMWPFWPCVSLVGVVYMLVKLTQAQWKDLAIVLGAAVGALIYYYAYLYPRRGKKWIMLEAVEEGAPEAPAVDEGPAVKAEPSA